MNEAAERIRLLEESLLDLAASIARGAAGKIHAIKAYRAATGTTLKESKDWVEALAARAIPSERGRLDRLEERVSRLERDISFQSVSIVRCFMDGIDWQHHLDSDANGTRLYPSERSLRRERKCIETGGCGVVEVEVRLVRWVEPQNLKWDHTNHAPDDMAAK